MSILPTEKRKPIKDLSQETIFIYGQPKVGKSTFASKFPNALFLSTEAGLNHLEVYDKPIRSWVEFLTIIPELEKGVNGFDTIVIDTVDNLFMLCQEFVYQKYNIQHESDLEWGKGWAHVEKEFRKQMTRLSLIKTMGLVLISHSETKEIKKRGQLEPETKVTHTLPNKARKLIAGMADMILYMETDEKNNRVIRTKETTEYEAGDRTGVLPPTILLDYEVFTRAYYGGENGDNTARKSLVDQIQGGLTYLKDHEIDSFHVPARVAESMKKHLGAIKLSDENITYGQLSAYLQHLRNKSRADKKENETNG